MLYEHVYDNRLQSLKSQIKLNEAVFGKRKRLLRKGENYILSIRILLRLCSALNKEQFSEKLSLSKHFPARGLIGSVKTT